MLSYGILELGKNIFVFKDDFPYSADAKPTVWFYLLAPYSMLSLCVYYDLYGSNQLRTNYKKIKLPILGRFFIT